MCRRKPAPDIRKLSEQGLITRHHGGAGRHPAWSIRRSSSAKSPTGEKRAIAEAIAAPYSRRLDDFHHHRHDRGARRAGAAQP
ncbi:DeoR family transcriptional regulator [Shigella flexneri]